MTGGVDQDRERLYYDRPGPNPFALIDGTDPESDLDVPIASLSHSPAMQSLGSVLHPNHAGRPLW